MSDDRSEWLEQALAGLGKPGFRIQEAWFSEDGLLHLLIVIPLDPPREEPASGGGGPNTPRELWALMTA